jgi:hypothetical protein
MIIKQIIAEWFVLAYGKENVVLAYGKENVVLAYGKENVVLAYGKENDIKLKKNLNQTKIRSLHLLIILCCGYAKKNKKMSKYRDIILIRL